MRHNEASPKAIARGLLPHLDVSERSWGPLQPRGRKAVARAAPVNRLRDTPSGQFEMDFGGNIGRATITRRGERVAIRFHRGLTATGTYFDIPGHPAVQFRNLRFSSNLAPVVSAPTSIIVGTDRYGGLYAKLDRSLIVGSPIEGLRPPVEVLVRENGVFSIDD